MTGTTRTGLARPASAVLAAGLCWALLLGVLYGAGHAPSVTLVPIPRERYYLFQALFVAPLLLVQWAALALAARLVLGRTVTSVRRTAELTGVPFGLVILGYVLVDAALYATGGFAALTAAARWLGPLVALALWLAVAAPLRRHTDARWPRALLASLAALVGQALVGAPLLR